MKARCEVSEEHDDYNDPFDPEMAWARATAKMWSDAPRLTCLPKDEFDAMEAKAAQYDALRAACEGLPETLEAASRRFTDTIVKSEQLNLRGKAAALRKALKSKGGKP